MNYYEGKGFIRLKMSMPGGSECLVFFILFDGAALL